MAEQTAAAALAEGLQHLRDAVIADVARFGYSWREVPFQLSSGFKSHDYIDGKLTLAAAPRRRRVASAILALINEQGIGLEFDAVGGLTMGADNIAVAVSDLATEVADGRQVDSFSVRKEEKAHGKQGEIAGTPLGHGVRVLLVDDVVTSGRSILQALDAIQAKGAEVVFSVALVDRGEATRRRLNERGVRYEPLITYRDLGIEPVPDEPART